MRQIGEANNEARMSSLYAALMAESHNERAFTTRVSSAVLARLRSDDESALSSSIARLRPSCARTHKPLSLWRVDACVQRESTAHSVALGPRALAHALDIVGG